MIEPRPYQKDAVESALLFFKEGSREATPIIVAPTGAGKSIIIACIAKELKKGVLILQPSKELLEQNYAKFKMYGGKASIYSASLKTKEIGEVTFATIGSVKNKASEFSHVKYVLIDECHLVPPQEQSMFVGFLKSLNDAKVLGLTATPFRLKKYVDPFSGIPYSQINLLMRERPKFFNSFLHITQISELYEHNFLSPVKYIELIWSNGSLKPNSTGAEYSDESVDKSLKEQLIHERIPSLIAQSIQKGRKHRIVFVKNVIDAQLLATKVPDSACVHAQTNKKDREQILKDFKSGKIKTIFNVNILTIGFDFPALDTIIIARPTMSLALYMQMIGRGIRQSPGKVDCAVVDMCGNIRRFSRLEKIRFEQDFNGRWVIRDDKRVLSGVKLSP